MSVKNNRNSKNERINKSGIDKKTKKRNPNEPIVIEFNLSKAVAILIAIVVLITSIITAKVVTTIMEAKETKVLASEEQEQNSKVTWVESTHLDAEGNIVTDLDADGNPIKVPVPKGYTASKIDGETSANTGFVIYEGDVDWSTIIVEEAEVATVNEINTYEANTKENTTEEVSINETATDETSATSEATNSSNDITNINDVDSLSNSSTDVVTDSNLNENSEINNKTLTDDITEDDIVEDDTTAYIAPLADDTTTEETTTTTTETTTVTQTDINIFNLQKTTNQYVWVPVSDISRIYGVDSNGKLWGKLYRFPTSETGRRSKNNWTETNGIMSISSKTSHSEPDVTHYNTKYDIDSKLPGYLNGQTQYELLSKELEENFYATIKSIKEYGGFYIGRYETGRLNGTAVVRKMDTNIANQSWYTMYEKCKTLSGTNKNVATSMIWGCLWDETLEWLYESGATISNGTVLTRSLIASNSKTWGNYLNSTFYYIASTSEIPEATETKATNANTRIPAGSSDYTKVNNIYDLAGNVWDWTLEAYSPDVRVCRGGSFNYYSYYNPSSFRDSYSVPTSYDNVLGCRALLLIK